MYGRNYIETNKGLDVYRKRCVTFLSLNALCRCMDIHLKKLNEIKRANTVKRVDDTKKVDEYLNRRHVDKMRTAEFEKQGKRFSFQL
jgi:hypothetical protein